MPSSRLRASARPAAKPRLLLAVHTFANSYIHLPAHLADAGLEVDLIARPGNPILASRSVRRRWRVPGADADFAAAIAARLGAGDYAALQLADEPALLALFSVAPDPRVAPYLPFTHPVLLAGIGRKDRFHAWCDQAGLPAPRTAHAATWPAVADAVASLGLPCYLKGSTGSGGQTVRRLETASDLDAARAPLAAAGPWLVQEQIRGAPCSVQFAAHRGRLLGWFALHKRVVLGEGRGPAVVGEFCAPEGLEDVCARACAAGGLNGLHGFDFMLSPEGRPLLIDPHLGRCTTLKHFGPRCGVNLAAAWRDALLGRPAPVQRPATTGGVFAKFPEILEYYCEQGPRRASDTLHPWRPRLHIGYGLAREFPAIGLAVGQLLINRARIFAGALRRRVFA